MCFSGYQHSACPHRALTLKKGSFSPSQAAQSSQRYHPKHISHCFLATVTDSSSSQPQNPLKPPSNVFSGCLISCGRPSLASCLPPLYAAETSPEKLSEEKKTTRIPPLLGAAVSQHPSGSSTGKLTLSLTPWTFDSMRTLCLSLFRVTVSKKGRILIRTKSVNFVYQPTSGTVQHSF